MHTSERVATPLDRWRADTFQNGRYLATCYSRGAHQHRKERIKLKNVHSREAVYTTGRLFDVLWLKQRSGGPCTAEF
jgi:hypothetical protein